MALVKQFDRALDRMWKKYSAAIRSLIRSHPGRPPQFSKKWRNEQMAKLLSLAESILCKQGAKKELAKITQGRRWRQVSGRGQANRYERLRSWAKCNVKGRFIYSFWRRRKCLYVGKASSWRRLGAYRKATYIRDATRLRIDFVRRRSELEKAECLAIHVFRPADNEKKAPKKKWGKACPICVVHDKLRATLREFFRIK